MTDDDCGCKCLECRRDDLHRCGRPECGYTKALAAMKRPDPHVTVGDALPKEALRFEFRRLADPDAKARLLEWAQFCEDTAGLEYEIRQAKRAEKSLEIFGYADYRRSGVAREEI